jgi:hypothetical protein
MMSNQSRLIFCACLGLTALTAQAADRPLRPGEYNPAHQTVELFAAIAADAIAVKYIPESSKKARVLIENKTDQPLNVTLPEAFAGVPILAQPGGGFGPFAGAGVGQGGGGNQNQSTGGGFQGGGNGQFGAAPGGVFNVAPEKVAVLPVDIVCLDHGLRDPTPAVPYEIRPLESCTTKPGVREMLVMYARGQLNHSQAQAAAWHLNNDMSWSDLGDKYIQRASGRRYAYFHRNDLRVAVEASEAAIKQAQEKARDEQTTSPGQLAAE